MVGQLRNVILALAKWGQVDLHGIDSVEEILPEGIVCYHFVHRHVGGTDQSDIYRNRLVGPDAGYFSFLEHSEQLGLQGHG